MDVFAFSAPFGGAVDCGVGFAFVASVVGLVVAFVPAFLAVRSVGSRSVRGAFPKLSVVDNVGRLGRRVA